MQTGLVLGKFLPPHQGHCSLIRFAAAHVDALTVVVETRSTDPIPGELRTQWIRHLFPDVDVVRLKGNYPQHPDEHPEFWDIWREALLSTVGEVPHRVFTGEPYGEALAAALSSTWVPFDRAPIPVSGTAVRNDPIQHWAWLPEPVRLYYLKRVAIVGAESTGKTTLGQALARHYATVCVPEYARIYLEALGRDPIPSDYDLIARGQLATEEAMAPLGRGVLFTDTDALSTSVWAEVLGETQLSEDVLDAARRQPYDLTLVLAADVPWVDDPVRYLPERGETFQAILETRMVEAGRHIALLRGDWEGRLSAAFEAVDALLG